MPEELDDTRLLGFVVPREAAIPETEVPWLTEPEGVCMPDGFCDGLLLAVTVPWDTVADADAELVGLVPETTGCVPDAPDGACDAALDPLGRGAMLWDTPDGFPVPCDDGAFVPLGLEKCILVAEGYS